MSGEGGKEGCRTEGRKEAAAHGALRTALQAWQLREDPLPKEELAFPTAQGTQAEDELLFILGLYLPAEHLVQVDAPVEALYVPSAQDSHAVLRSLSLNFPAAQDKHAEDEAMGLYVPSAHERQEESEVAPELGLYKPAEQLMHEVARELGL